LKAFEDVIVDFDAVCLLTGGRRQFRERLEPLRLRLRVVSERRRLGANPRVVLLDALVRTESVVVVGRVGGRPAERRDPVLSIRAEKQVAREVRVRDLLVRAVVGVDE